MMTESPPAHQNCEGQEAAAAEKYRADIATVLREVAAGPRFRESAALRAERLKAAGGIPRAAAALAHTVHGSPSSCPQDLPVANATLTQRQAK